MLIWNLANLRQKTRPETIQLCSPECCLQRNSVVCLICLMDALSNRSTFSSQPLFHLVTDRASLLTVQGTSSLPILAKYKHFTTMCAQKGANSPVRLETTKEKLVIIHA